MGTQITSTNDRSRTYWTPTMEHYFIDLMLEQMHRGNRIGHTFSKQAWTDMLSVFNGKFGSQYDKDVLKNRYTNLWKQFNDIKNLLSQGGFSWDEARQMVIADEYVWNAYIKAHPDARPYKTKQMLNFDDLCVIYGHTAADGRYSRSSHDLDFEDENQGANMGDGTVTPAFSSNERPRTDWTTAMDQYFIELMLHQIGRGNKIGNTFNKQAWKDMLALFNAKFGPQHGKRVLRHRHKKLWKYYSDMTVILKQDGFSWDETRQIITADDSVWDAYIKAHPNSRTYRMKALPSYHDLVLIYAGAVDEGDSGYLPQDNEPEYEISGVKAGERRVSQIPSGGDRTRTYWTPPMDRYLIDLLLHQVHRGNKLGQTFITQAWVDMVTLFNTKFGSNHDKDVLKNRYKHLRRQYNDVKFLLEQSGFSWNEARDMVTAEDNVWDAYIKEHPDARSYRVKTVPSYHKLCFIFGEDISDGRYTRLAQNMDANRETPMLMTGKEKNDYLNSSINPTRIEWTLSMDHYLIDLMLEQMHRGTKISQTFTEQAWADMVVSFNEKFAVQSDIYILENRYICLMKEHDDISNLLSQGGFFWDESKQMVTSEDVVWEAYIKEHPDFILYRDKFLGYYNDLCKICGNEVPDGRVINEDVGMEIEKNDETQEMGMDGVSGDLGCQTAHIELCEQHRKRPALTPLASEPLNKASKTGEVMKKASEMAGAVTTMINKKENKNYITIESAVDALQTIPDIDDELLLDACDLLEDERKAKTFLALDVTLRKKWLLRKLRP